MTVRPLLPYQSGNQAAWAASNVPALLFDGALPRSTKKVEPGSPSPLSVMPHWASDA